MVYKKVIKDANTGEITEIDFTPEEMDEALARETESLWTELRSTRDRLLQESDIFVLPDRWDSYTNQQKTDWKTYRQALRDLPENITDINNVIWPSKPVE